MLWKLIIRNTIIPLVLLLAMSLWVVTTESGLNMSFWVLSAIAPGKLSSNRIEGKWINQIKIEDLNFESKFITLKVQELVIHPKLLEIFNNRFEISSFSIKNLILGFKKLSVDPCTITEASGRLSLKVNGKIVAVEVNHLNGRWANKPLNGYGVFKNNGKQIEISNSSFTLGNNQFRITPALQPNQLNWRCIIAEPDTINVDLEGFLITSKSLNDWAGEITKVQINSKLIGIWNLKEATKIILSEKNIVLQTLQLQNSFNQLLTMFINWDHLEGMKAVLKTPTLMLQHPKFQGKASLDFTTIQKQNHPPSIKAQLRLYPGAAVIPISNSKFRKFSYNGGNIDLTVNEKILNLVFDFKENKQNTIVGTLKVGPFIKSKPFVENPIEGHFSIKWSDLSPFYSFIPHIAKLKGYWEMFGKVEGKIDKPLFKISSELKNVYFFIPRQAIQMKDLNVKFEGNIPGKLALEGYGKSGEGSFNLKGICDFNDQIKSSLEVTGKNLQIYNTPNIQITASSHITLDYSNRIFFAQGNVQIPKAYIAVRDNKNYIMPSKDVVIVNSGNKEEEPPFKIVPSLYLTIDNHLHFKGYGLDGVIGGKLAIDQRPDGLLSATGRLTIKEGKYRLQSATRYIHHGHLLFPPGTLLNDPILDIRISQKRTEEQQEGTDVGLYVQGTLQNPVPHLYSSAQLQNTEILSRLGFGGSEIAGTKNQRQVLTQTAFLLSGNANPVIDALQTNLKIEELTLESRETNRNLLTQGGTDTVLVVGKSLSRKLYLQYLQNVMEPISTIKLKYYLGRHFSTSIETGTQGLGGDIVFSMERD